MSTVNSILSTDPGRNLGIALFVDRELVESDGIPITSFIGAKRMHEAFDRAQAAGIQRLVIEDQYPGRGRGFKTQVGLAVARGAVLHEGRLHRFRQAMVAPGEWKRAACYKLSVAWSADPEVKSKAILRWASQLKGEPIVSQDEADAIVMGHWYLNQGLYL